MESMKRRASIITFDDSGSISSSNWQASAAMINSRKTSSTSTQSNLSTNNIKNIPESTNSLYQQTQLMSYPTV